MNRGRITFTFLLLSLLAAGGFSIHLWRERRQVHVLTLATASRSGEYYAFGHALAKVVARHYPHIQIKVIPTEGTSQNLSFLNENTAQLALIQGDSTVQASAQAVALLFPEVAHVLVNTQSGIETMADLQGKQIALPPKGSGAYQLFMPIAQHYEINIQQHQPSTSAHDAYDQLQRGRADALFQVIRPGSAAIRQVLRSQTLRLLPIKQTEALRLTYPFLEAASIPEGIYDGTRPIPTQDVQTVAVRALLIARRQVDEEVVYAIARILQDRRMELVAEYPPAFTIEPTQTHKILGWSIHSGAERYYNKNQPNFWVQYAELLGLFLSLSVLVVSGIWQCRLWLIGRQKNRADMYNLQLLALIEAIQDTQDLEELSQLRQRLLSILQAVVVDLDKDRISPESFQSFTLPWEVAITTLRHRETILLRVL
ncbi:TAXI family TRAP transporter solute-binding subunit [Acaryochloris sp. IP29b_bin.148]|uniref:TAXI family TRAP transporter solute-binding subunit n=1 Tax=Acaryochloris sp. IP29b_bin.148 TaxID=2969218 RepID=UPI0026330802|nr:TAXI family TRAP transporter solute-binding subunit [Acaryochloris sp. IP29b_bin.148]